MLLPLHWSLLALWLLQPISAAVYFQGKLGPLGDIAACTSEKYNDNDLANLLAFEFPKEAKRTGNTFFFPTPMICGIDYATDVEYACSTLDGTPSCINSLLPVDSILPRANNLFKRTVSYCKDASETCDHTVQANHFATCPNGYREEQVSAPGFVAGYLCSKPCTPEQLNECLSSVCDYRRKQCSQYPASREICGDGLIKCRKLGPFTMRQEICTDNLIPDSGDFLGNKKCTGCVSFADGKCTLDNTAFEAFTKANNAAADKLVKAGAFGRFGEDSFF